MYRHLQNFFNNFYFSTKNLLDNYKLLSNIKTLYIGRGINNNEIKKKHPKVKIIF